MPKKAPVRRLRAMARSLQQLLQQHLECVSNDVSVIENFLNFSEMVRPECWRILLDARAIVPNTSPPKKLLDEFFEAVLQPWIMDRIEFSQLLELRRLVAAIGKSCHKRWHVRRRRFAEALSLIDRVTVERAQRALPIDLPFPYALSNWVSRAADCRKAPGAYGVAGERVAEEVTRQLEKHGLLADAIQRIGSSDDNEVTRTLDWICGSWNELRIDAEAADSLMALLFADRDESGSIARDVAILRFIRKCCPLLRGERHETLRHQLLRIVVKFYELHELRGEFKMLRHCRSTLEVMAEG